VADRRDVASVLVVDDDGLVLQLLETLLRRGGYDVLATVSASVALALARRERPDALLVDVTLGRESGATLINRIRALPGLGSTPAILMSGGDPVSNRARAESLGALFLPKPTTAAAVLDVVATALTASGALAPVALD
jgi:CheY-like chemotaxis protein